MKTCCNPMGRPHSTRKKLRFQKVPADLIPWFRRLHPNIDWNEDLYMCAQCFFDLRRKAEMLKIVSASTQIARKSTSKQRHKTDAPSSTSKTQCSLEGPVDASAEVPLESNDDDSENGMSTGSPSSLPPMPASPILSTSTSASSDLATPSAPMSSQEPSVIEGRGNNPSPPTSSLASFETAHRLDTTLQAMDVTPIRRRSTGSQYAVKKTYGKAQQKLKGMFDLFTKQKFSISPGPKEKSCHFCSLLLRELSARFPTLPNKTTKYQALTCVPKRFGINDFQANFQTSIYMIRHASTLRSNEGAFSSPVFNYGHPLSENICEMVRQFYLSSDNSRPSPRADDVIYIKTADGRKERAAKHRILTNLGDLYETFKKENPHIKVSESKFAKLRPKNCVWPGKRGFHNTCLCEIHQNFEFMLSALDTNDTVTSFIQKILCQNPTTECFNGLCINCPNVEALQGFYVNIMNEDEVEFMQWQHTDATDIKKVIMCQDQFRQEFEAYVPKIIEHDYVYRRQSEFIKSLKNETLQNQTGVTVHVDFAQNYTFLIQNAVQGFHWSNRQATVHPFVVHWWNNECRALEFRTYCVISNELTHDADTFHAFRSVIVPRIREDLEFLNFQTIYYISDGAGSQYKNFKNFANLVHHEEDFGLRAEWHFTATAHGKSTCDAISGVVKSVTRMESLKPGIFITSAEEMSKFCEKKLTTDTLQIVYIDKRTVDRQRAALALRYKRYKTIPGTRKYHMFCPDQTIMTMRHTSSSASATRYNFLLGEVTRFNFETLQLGSFYSFYSSSNYQIGMVVDTNETEGEALIQVLKLNRRNGKMEYPTPLMFLEVPLRDIFGQVSDPVTADGVVYTFVEQEFEAVKASYRTFRAKPGN